MRRSIGPITTLILILTALPALGKGPSSLTVTGPGIDDPIELLNYPDHDLQTRDLIASLMRLTGVWYGNMGLEETSEQPPDVDLGPAYKLTWSSEANPGNPTDDFTIHQTLYPHADGGPVVHTPRQPALDDTSLTLGWRTVPDELTDTLRQLGIPIDSAVQSPRDSQSIWAFVALAVIAIAGAIRLVNSRLRPVVSSQ